MEQSTKQPNAMHMRDLYLVERGDSDTYDVMFSGKLNLVGIQGADAAVRLLDGLRMIEASVVVVH